MPTPTTTDLILTVAREGLYLAMLLAAPILLAALAAGLVIGVLQAMTQVHEHSIGFVPKAAVVVMAVSMAAPWIGRQLVAFTTSVLELIPQLGSL